MVSKAEILTALATIQVIFPMSAIADDLSGWIGTYSSTETNFVTLKRLTFTKEKDGSIKIRGALVGFPDEVSIGEATAQPYADRGNKSRSDTMLATFSSEKYKPFMVLNSNPIGSSKPAQIQFTCYMTDVDGSKIHLNGYLNREPDTTGK